MAISSVAIQSFERASQTSMAVEHRAEQADTKKAGHHQPLTFEERREATNTNIMEAHLKVSIGSKNEPNSLLFKTAIEAINKELEATHGKNITQKNADEGMDFSPEATAERIVGFATMFFSQYQQQHTDKSLEDQLNSFIDIVGGGAEKGFGEAKDILSGLKVYNGEVKENAEKTHDLIFEGFEKFRQSVLEANKPAEEAAAA
jgi:hypothetical protein